MVSTYIMDFLKYYEIDERTKEVTLDLIDDIYARTDLSVFPQEDNGEVFLICQSGRSGYYRVSNGRGGLPDDDRVVLVHNDELLMDIVSNGSLIQNARASNGVCIEINARQKLLETKVAI
jgi:hypothetical protein